MNVWCQENGGNDDVILSSYQMIWKMFCVIKMGILLCVFFLFEEGKYLRHLKCQWFSARAWHLRMCFPPKIVWQLFSFSTFLLNMWSARCGKKTPLKMLNQITEMKIHYKCISFSACLVVLFWLVFMLKNDKKKRWLSFLQHVSHSMKLN